jgi:predicted ATPase
MMRFGLSNLRRLKLIEPIELKPLTILVGRNSSGKSSFLRAFPLLRQSLVTRTSSPILWYGDLVDFGSFDTSISEGATNEPITFSFVLDEIERDDPSRFFYWRSSRRRSLPPYRGLHLSVSIVRFSEQTRIATISVFIESTNTKFDISVDEKFQVSSITLNGKNVSSLVAPIQFQITPGTILPEMSALSQKGKTSVLATQRFMFPSRLLREQDPFTETVKKIIKSHAKRISDQYLEVIAQELLALGISDRKEILEQIGKVGSKAVQKLVSNIAGRDSYKIYSTLSDIMSISALPDILFKIRSILRSVISSTLYIGPARARSERYYRYQDLAVSEIDPDGKNFAMFLNSLNYNQTRELSQWIERLFGYGVHVVRQSGHISINLVTEGMESNIVDTGYGVSQILPVLGQIWWARTRLAARAESPSAVSLLAIEQPELHLHPAHQAFLADAMVGELTTEVTQADTDSRRIHFLIETHSETLLNRLGELVSLGRIRPADVQVILFEPNQQEVRLTDVRTSSFNDAGELVDWPYGFFQAR